MNSVAQETPQQAARRLAAKAIRNGFGPEAIHTYTDPDGKPLHWRIRLKHPGTGNKWIRPMKQNGERFTLGEPEYPDGKPLYRLHDMAARPDDVVIVTEGEWCADALAKVGVLATTSGGADSAGSADWRPLAGRCVTIWPDNDESGRRYGDAVAAVLRELNCIVRVVDVDALALSTKADAVEWLAANSDATAADIAALPIVDAAHGDESSDVEQTPSTATPVAPAIDSPARYDYGRGRFELSKDGMRFIETDDHGHDKTPMWLCSPLHVVAKTRDAKSGGVGTAPRMAGR